MKNKYIAVLTAMIFVILCITLSACSVQLEHTHTPNPDDGDCTTAVTCSTCNEISMAARVHAPSENWSKDETSHWNTCANEGCTKVVGEKTSHTQTTSDGDCATADACSVCQKVISAKSHVPSENWSKDDSQHWKVCINDGCTKVVVEKTSHTPNPDDGDCTTAVICSTCNEITTTARVHTPSENWSDETSHWKICTNEGCTTVVVEKSNHTPTADDSDCTTADTCFVCQEVLPSKIHTPSENWSKDETCHWKTCVNEGCTTVVVEKTSHTMKNGYNVCEFCNNIDLSIFTIIDEDLLSCNPGAYTSITIPDSVTAISSNAFSRRSGLTSITIPNSVTAIGDYAFGGCSGLTSITIPASVTAISSNAFYGCYGLTIYAEASVMPDGWASNWNSSNCAIVWDCKNNEVAADGNIYYIAENGIRYALKDNIATVVGQSSGLSGAIEIPSTVTYKNNSYSVTSIGSSAFSYCSGLTSITIPNSVTAIGDGTFRNCSGLTIITIPESVTAIGDGAFRNCSGLTIITIPNSVTIIGSNAFSYCSGLTSITIPNSVTDISNSAFYGCSGGLTIYAEASVMPDGWASNWNSSNCAIVWDCKSNEVAADGNIYYIAENGIRYALKDNVATVARQYEILSGAKDIPSTVTYKNDNYNVTSIGDFAFSGCSGLTSITIGNSVTAIGDSAFSGCSGLTSITIGNSVTAIGDSAFYGCSSLTSIMVAEGNSNYSSQDGILYNREKTAFIHIPSKLAGVVIIPEGITAISSNAFRNCSGLTSISIPESMTRIGSYAFFNCSSLASITIPNSVTSIGNYAFGVCSSLTSITIGNGVTAIGSSVFSGCSGLTNTTYSGTIAQWVAITKGSNWNSGTRDYTITCIDGTLTKAQS